jgi:hypothetical protein
VLDKFSVLGALHLLAPCSASDKVDSVVRSLFRVIEKLESTVFGELRRGWP